MRPSHLPSEFSLYVLRLGCWHGTALAYAVSALGEWHGSESNVMEAQLPAYEHCCDLLAEKNEVQQTAFDFSCPEEKKPFVPRPEGLCELFWQGKECGETGAGSSPGVLRWTC